MDPQHPEPVTYVEGMLLRAGLAAAAHGQVLEVGCGHGRLVPWLTRDFDSYVGIDPHLPLRASPARAHDGAGGFVLGDGHHLPFADSSFDAVALVRVYHRLSRPERALAEAHRVLRPRGVLAVFVMPSPSLWTLWRDARGFARGTPERMTRGWGPGGRFEFRRGEGGGFLEPVHLSVARIREAGFTDVVVRRCGLESLPVLRHLPPELWFRFSNTLGVGPLFPSAAIFGRAR